MFMNDFLNEVFQREKPGGILTTGFICFQHLVFGVAVVVTLMLNVGGAQDLQVMVGLSQVLHCCGHVQRRDPKGGENLPYLTKKSKTFSHIITLLLCMAAQYLYVK